MLHECSISKLLAMWFYASRVERVGDVFLKNIIYLFTSMILLWFSFTLFPWSIGRPSTNIGLLPSEDIKKSPLFRRRMVACFLETFAAGPSKLKSTSIVWSRVLRPTAIWNKINCLEVSTKAQTRNFLLVFVRHRFRSLWLTTFLAHQSRYACTSKTKPYRWF